MAQWREEMYERQQQRIMQMSDAASDLIDLESLFASISADERLSDMFRMAVDQAVLTSSEAKLRLLGRALASGALTKDEAAVDEAAELLRVAASLEAVDLRALAILKQRRRQGRPFDLWDTLSAVLRIDEAVCTLVIARLQRIGLLELETEARLNDPRDPENDFVDLHERWRFTAAVDRLLEFIQERSIDGPD